MGLMSDEELANETPEERKARWRSASIGGRAAGQKSFGDPAKQKPRPIQQPVWEGGKVKDHRGIPYVHAHNPDAPVTVKQFANRRGHYEKSIRDLRNRTTPLP